jgi:hypothetical protein|tara:strand:- start:183 stop:386 length:204 start_codon:yes stop_codon:yes gene_type:complete
VETIEKMEHLSIYAQIVMMANKEIKMRTSSTKSKATKFNVISFRNYDGTSTLKVVTREQYNRLTGKR